MPDGSAAKLPRSSRGPREKVWWSASPVSDADGGVRSGRRPAAPRGAPSPVAVTATSRASERANPAFSARSRTLPDCPKAIVAWPAASVVASTPVPATRAPATGVVAPSLS